MLKSDRNSSIRCRLSPYLSPYHAFAPVSFTGSHQAWFSASPRAHLACYRAPVTWSEFEAAVPELARLGRERFERAGLALLGTIRRDGSPRISPIEPHLAVGQLLLGMLPRSLKALDLHRDPRCVVHSCVSDPDGREGEFKLYGRAVVAEDRDARSGRYKSWWKELPPGSSIVYSFIIEGAAFVSWDMEKGLMTVRRWSPEAGLRESTSPYGD